MEITGRTHAIQSRDRIYRLICGVNLRTACLIHYIMNRVILGLNCNTRSLDFIAVTNWKWVSRVVMPVISLAYRSITPFFGPTLLKTATQLKVVAVENFKQLWLLIRCANKCLRTGEDASDWTWHSNYFFLENIHFSSSDKSPAKHQTHAQQRSSELY